MRFEKKKIKLSAIKSICESIDRSFSLKIIESSLGDLLLLFFFVVVVVVVLVAFFTYF